MRYTSLLISSLTILILVVFSCALTNKHLKRIGPEEFIDNSKLLYETGLPVHAHLDDGSVVIFENGFYLVETTDSTFMNSNFRSAIRYSLDRQQKDTIFTLDYSKVAYVDVVEKRLDGLAFLLSLPGALITSAITAVAIFGSCPTVYSMDGNIEHLEAECFSYSINPRFEMQDVDKLEYPDFKDGILKLELRNEALETHYINTFKVLTVDHEPGHKILPKESGSMIEWKKELIEIGPLFNDYIVRDKLNNDISHLTAFEDEQYFSSSDKAVEEAVFDEESNDWIIMDFYLPEHQTELFLGFKLRSTFLNTVLLYDLLLDAQNLGAIDWTGTTSQGMWYAYNFAKWYHKNFGLHIEVLKNGEFVEVTQLGDSGPIVWSKLGVRIPLFEGGQTSVRFKFITDNWHIDWIGVSLSGNQEPVFKEHDISSIKGGDKGLNIISKASNDDDEYLITYPGHNYSFNFDVGNNDDKLDRSFFIQAKGYYIEWLRKDWLLADEGEALIEDVSLDNTLIRNLFEKWHCEKATMEDFFFETMIPVINKNETGD